MFLVRSEVNSGPDNFGIRLEWDENPDEGLSVYVAFMGTFESELSNAGLSLEEFLKIYELYREYLTTDIATPGKDDIIH